MFNNIGVLLNRLKILSIVLALIVIIGIVGIKDSKADLADFDNNFLSQPNQIKHNVENIVMNLSEKKEIKASWYGPKFHGKLTANGENYDQMLLTAAHKTLPFGTLILLTNEENGKQAIIRINDRGPYIGNREFDLSKGAALALGTIKKGVVHLNAQFIEPTEKIIPIN